MAQVTNYSASGDHSAEALTGRDGESQGFSCLPSETLVFTHTVIPKTSKVLIEYRILLNSPETRPALHRPKALQAPVCTVLLVTQPAGHT